MSCQLLIIDLLYKNFQEQQINSRRFPVFPEGISNSSRFPQVVDTLFKGPSTRSTPVNWHHISQKYTIYSKQK